MMTMLEGMEVNVCSATSFMGHEELALPMLARDCGAYAQRPGQGRLRHALNPDFKFDNLAGTAVAGYMAGMRDNDVWMLISEESVWLDGFGCFHEVPEIRKAIDALGCAFAFFHEASSSPLQDGYIRRCRLISRDRLPDYYQGLDVAAETAQPSAAGELLSAFLEGDRFWTEDKIIELYGRYCGSREFRGRYGDPEYFYVGTAVWLEQDGVIRAWTRVTYAPK